MQCKVNLPLDVNFSVFSVLESRYLILFLFMSHFLEINTEMLTMYLCITDNRYFSQIYSSAINNSILSGKMYKLS